MYYITNHNMLSYNYPHTKNNLELGNIVLFQVTTLHPNKLGPLSTTGIYDAVVSYSSIEHSGLTRYGDAPHPWGDLVTMAKLWCYVKYDGLAFIGVPTSLKDTLSFNAAR